MATRIIAVINLTPDSFSGDNLANTPGGVYEAVKTLHKNGVTIIDFGAESTRPGATPISAQEERERLSSITDEVMEYCAECAIEISIDTRHAENAAWMLSRGAAWVNDVGGFADSAMVQAVLPHACKLVVMHSLSVPANPALTLPEGEDVMEALLKFFRARTTALTHAGIDARRIVLDPGIGFGKTAAQSMAIITRVDELKTLGFPILIGHSRKSFLKAFGVNDASRDNATLLVSAHLAQHDVEYLRVHDAVRHVQLLPLMQALKP